MAEWTKKQGYVLLEPGTTGVRPLLWDDAVFARLTKAKTSDTWIYSRETPTTSPEVFVTNARLEQGRQLTHTQAEVDPFAWTAGSMLIDFQSDKKSPSAPKGEHLQASLHLPANYEKGKQYPTIVYIYERLTQGHDNFPRPAVPGTGFNIGFYTSNGYAVLEPDIKYYVNDPGMSAVWAIVPAVKAAIATGIVDPTRVALHGHSWGGYQTAFTITQTNIFKAAAAGAPLTDMISMYALIYKNSGETNGAIFESSQGRFTGPPLEVWDAYTRNSPVRWAANVKTPLLILSNDKDGAVDFTQGIGDARHAASARQTGRAPRVPGRKPRARQAPQHARLHGTHEGVLRSLLDGRAGTGWLENGIPLSKMQQHIDERLKKDVKPAPAPAPKNGAVAAGRIEVGTGTPFARQLPALERRTRTQHGHGMAPRRPARRRPTPPTAAPRRTRAPAPPHHHNDESDPDRLEEEPAEDVGGLKAGAREGEGGGLTRGVEAEPVTHSRLPAFPPSRPRPLQAFKPYRDSL